MIVVTCARMTPTMTVFFMEVSMLQRVGIIALLRVWFAVACHSLVSISLIVVNGWRKGAPPLKAGVSIVTETWDSIGRIPGPRENPPALLLAWCHGDSDALDALLPLVYEELRRLAGRYMKGERSGHTLQ